MSGDRGEAQAFMREIAAPFRNAYDRGLQSVAWGVSGLPTAIRLDAQGRIAERDVFAPRYLSDS